MKRKAKNSFGVLLICFYNSIILLLKENSILLFKKKITFLSDFHQSSKQASIEYQIINVLSFQC